MICKHANQAPKRVITDPPYAKELGNGIQQVECCILHSGHQRLIKAPTQIKLAIGVPKRRGKGYRESIASYQEQGQILGDFYNEAAMPGEIVTRNMENYNTIIKIIMAYMYTYNMHIIFI